MRIFTKSLIAFASLCFAGVVNAQTPLVPTFKWKTVESVGWVHEWRTNEAQTDGPARTDEEGSYYIYVRSKDQAYQAGNAIEQNGNYADHESQFFIDFGADNTLKAGQKFRLTMDVKANANQNDVATQSHANPGGYLNWQCIGNVNFTTEWKPFDSGEKAVGDAPKVGMHSIAFNLAKDPENTFYFKNIKVQIGEEETPTVPVGMKLDGKAALIATGPSNTNPWDNQFYYNLQTPLTPGGKYILKVKMMTDDEDATKNHDLQLLTSWEASENKNQWGGTNDVSYLPWISEMTGGQLTNEFVEYTWEFTSNWANDRITFQIGTFNGNLFIDDISLKAEGSDVELIQDGSFSADGLSKWNATAGYGLPGITSKLVDIAVVDPEYRPETAVSVDVEINDTDPAIVAKKTALLTAINRAKDADRTNKTKASMKALDDAITEGYKLFAPEAQKKTVEVTIPGEVVKKELTFSTAEYCAASWDAATSTMTWGTGGWDPSFTFMTADDIKGDVTEWTKLHLNVSDFTNSAENKLKIKFKEDNGAWPPSGPETDFIEAPDADGNINIDLAAATWNTDRTKLADLTIYGMDRTDATATGSVKVNEAWLEKTTEDKVEEQVVDKTREEILAQLTAGAQAIRAAINNLEDRPAPIAELEVPAGWKSVIINGTLEGSDMSCFFSKDNSSDPYTSVAVDYEGKDGHKAIVLQTGGSKAGTDWEDQFFIRATESIPAGKKFHVEFDYRSDIDASGDTQCHEQPGNYIHWSCINSPSFKSDWQHYTFEGTVPSQCDGKPNDGNTFMKNFQTIAFNLSKTRKDVKFVFDNIQFWVEDDATIIKSVETTNGESEYFDLQGRRVAQPGKGLYIKNGKVVLVK